MHQRAKFHQYWSISCEHIKVLQFFKMMAAAILDCQIRNILLSDGLWRAQTHNYTKFHQNWSLGCGDIAISRIFKMAAAAINFFKSRNFIGY